MLRRLDALLARPAALRTMTATLVLLLVTALVTAGRTRVPTVDDAPVPMAMLPDEGGASARGPAAPVTAAGQVPPAKEGLATEGLAPQARARKGPAPQGQASTSTAEGSVTPAEPARDGEAHAAPASADERSPARRRFDAQFPAQAAARQDVAGPATTRWALLIGINDYQGRTHDNVASRQDAEDLATMVRALGWRDDHIVLLTDGDASRENIVEALDWIARKTDGDSLAIVSYSGHVKQWHDRDVDGDGEVPDEALWPADNRFIPDRELVDRLDAVDAGRLWVNVGACEAAGLADPGIRRPGRILTFSSQEDEKSYEDPSAGNSVWGEFLIEDGMGKGLADADGDGDVSVEEAYAFAAPRATKRTSSQSHGPQHPVLVDDVPGDLSLAVPARPVRSEPSPRPSPTSAGGSGCILLCDERS